MAVLASIASRNVIPRLSCCELSIVAGEAVAIDSCVIEDTDLPVGGDVTRLAFVACDRMAVWLSASLFSIMTGDAGLRHETMVQNPDAPARGPVTVVAQVRSVDVIVRLACRNFAVMAVKATCHDRQVIDVNGLPGDTSVTLTAAVLGLRMIFGLALCETVVVAFLANSRHALEHSARMAGFARHRGMGPFEFKSYTTMIEAGVNLRETVDFFCTSERDEDQGQEDQKQPQAQNGSRRPKAADHHSLVGNIPTIPSRN